MPHALRLAFHRCIAATVLLCGTFQVAEAQTDYNSTTGSVALGGGTITSQGLFGGEYYREVTTGNPFNIKGNFTNNSGGDLKLWISITGTATDVTTGKRVKFISGNALSGVVSDGNTGSVTSTNGQYHMFWPSGGTWTGGTYVVTGQAYTTTTGGVRVSDIWTVTWTFQVTGSTTLSTSGGAGSVLPTFTSAATIDVSDTGPATYSSWELDETFENGTDNTMWFTMTMEFPTGSTESIPISFQLAAGEEHTIRVIADELVQLVDIQYATIIDLDTGGPSYESLPDIVGTEDSTHSAPPTTESPTLQSNGPTTAISNPTDITQAARATDYSDTTTALSTLDTNEDARAGEALAAANKTNDLLAEGFTNLGEGIAGLRGDIGDNPAGDQSAPSPSNDPTENAGVGELGDKWGGLVSSTQTPLTFTVPLSVVGNGMDDVVIDFSSAEINPWVVIARQIMLVAAAIYFLVKNITIISKAFE